MTIFTNDKTANHVRQAIEDLNDVLKAAAAEGLIVDFSVKQYYEVQKGQKYNMLRDVKVMREI